MSISLLLLGLHFLLLLAQGSPLTDTGMQQTVPHAFCTTSGTITHSTRLQPTCIYRQTMSISKSDIELDCRGATLDGVNKLQDGIVIESSKQIKNIVVKNCYIKHFSRMGIYVKSAIPPQTRLRLGEEAQTAFTPSDITIRHNYILENGLGLFVGDHVDHYSISRNTIRENSDVGIYLEFGSSYGVVKANTIAENGWHKLSRTSPQITWPRIREAIAVDGSQHNLIYNNEIWGNAAGGIFLYRNCTEGGAINREAPRRIAGASFNVLLKNTIEGRGVGIWIAQRQSQNLQFQMCGNPYYYRGQITLDLSQNNVVVNNTIKTKLTGIVVEDDSNEILFNDLQSDEPCAVVGTKYRSELLGKSVNNAIFEGNKCLTGNTIQEFIFSYGADRSHYEMNSSARTHSFVQPH